ncbi:MAG TPA: group II intron reverse transcriptase/maturase [Coleofasciculaceae cyanobacterium]
MQDRVRNDIGTKEPLKEWASINWKLVKKRIRNLRQRIYRATQNRQWNKVRSLMKLMLRSYSNLLLSVRKVSLENQGKRTAGIDNQKVLTPKARVALVNEAQQKNTPWKVRPTKRVYIPKANGKQRPLGIPTIKDRIMQAVVKNALEPSWEARFEPNSFGFRPGRSCHDAIEQLWYRLNGHGKDEWVLDADIKGAFDNISHDYILKAIGEAPSRELIKQWLKAGYVEAEIFHSTNQGTPQGGIISPLLANIALDGLEELLSQYKSSRTYESTEKGRKRIREMQFPKYSLIRYADDFIVTATTKEDIEAIQPIIKQWLSERGLELNEEKTKVTSVNEGFNFLGFNIRSYKGKCLIKPQKEKVLAKLREIKEWLRNNCSAKPEAVINYLNPILRGWANYYEHGVSKEVFAYFDHEMVLALWRWAKKRHPNKGKKWVKNKYFGRVGNDHWVFKATTKDRTGKTKALSLLRMATIPITRHVKVSGSSSPDNPALVEYWEKRRTKYGKTRFEKGSKLYKVAENQKWHCPVCGEHLLNGEEWHTHHKISVKDGGTDEIDNLIHLHKACHRHLHSGQRSELQEA